MQWTRRDGADRRREKAVTTANDESGLTSQFTSLGRQVAAFGTILAPGASQVLGLLGAICALENAQSEVLQTIDSNVKLLKEGPFRSGRLMLQEAYRVGEREHEGRRLLAASKDRFFDALPLSASVQEQALVEFHLGLVGLLLGNKDDALHWFTKAYGSSRAVVEALSEEAGDVKVLKSKWSATALTVSYGAVLLVLPFKVRRVMRASRARSALDDYLPFVNAVATCMNSVNAGPAAPTLTITLNPDGGRTLRESAT